MNIGCVFLKKSFLIIGVLCSIFSYGQQIVPVTNNEIIRIAEIMYGTDDRLVNGMISQFYAPKAEGHPFFLSNDWQKGNIFSSGARFKEVTLKYNIESDDIYYINRQQASIIVLNKSIIDSVSIDNHLFVNSNKLNIKNPIGFIELLYQGNLALFLKYKIKSGTKHTDSYEYIKYYEPKTTIYLLKDSQLISIKSKKDLLTEFSPYQKEITTFLHQNKINFRNADHNQLLQIIKYCDELYSK